MLSKRLRGDNGKYDFVCTVTLAGCTVHLLTEWRIGGVETLTQEFDSEEEARAFYDAQGEPDPPPVMALVSDEQETEPRVFDFDLGEQDLAIADLLPRLETVIAGVDFPVSASDYPFHPFVWYSEYQGDFSLTGLLHAEGFLRPIALDEFLERVATYTVSLPSPLSEQPRLRGAVVAERCHHLRVALQTHFTHLTVYQMVTTEPGLRGDTVVDSFHLLLGQTTSGAWLGIAPRIGSEECGREETERLAIASGPPLSRDLLPLVQTLDPILTGLEFSTTDHTQTFRECVLLSRETPDQTLYELLDAIGFVVTSTFAPFALHDEVPDYDAIDQMLQNNLSDLREYVIGSCSLFHVYTVGRTQEGDWAGVKAIAVWA